MPVRDIDILTDFENDFSKDMPPMREVVYKKNKFIMERNDPYGLVKIRMERGQLPNFLDGQFTSFDQAEKRIQIYLNKMGENEEKLDGERST